MEAFVPIRTPPPPLGTRILSLEAQSDLQVVERLSQGLPTSSIEQLAAHLGWSVAQLLELTSVKSSTFFERKKRRQPLTVEASSQVYRLARVVEAAEAYLEDRERAPLVVASQDCFRRQGSARVRAHGGRDRLRREAFGAYGARGYFLSITAYRLSFAQCYAPSASSANTAATSTLKPSSSPDPAVSPAANSPWTW